ncbi:glycoside hydrolase family 95 protein [Echinicola salinicaeni]|uniref:glycoside hydrolase family 95 protein n=1 Tax=Echinicola salinicaeni TaxID=2762757 RepID=UPI0016487E67|nr:glycoside hydrolase family 95 protein [Echinicola salinicaeni]
MKKIFIIIYCFSTLINLSCTPKEDSKTNTKIWYKQPAKNWNEALPVGNGRLGAMIYGKTDIEHIQLNEDSLWPGGPNWGTSQGNPEDLKAIRKLIKEGKVHAADRLIVEKFSKGRVVRSHQTMGDLFIDFDRQAEIENYTRDLSFDNALATVSYSVGESSFSEHVFSSAVDDVLVIQLETDAKEGMNFDLSLSRPEDKGHPTVMVSVPNQHELVMSGEVTQYGAILQGKPTPLESGVKFETRLKVSTKGGNSTVKGNSLSLTGVNEAIIYIVCNTSFYSQDFKANNEATLAKLENKSLDNILKDHKDDFSEHYNRVSIDLGNHELDSLATDERLQLVKTGKKDAGLAATLFQYGRYLLISSSRPGTNPANLQGIWNEFIEAPWNADYHLNINLQMNYWPAGPTNLAEMQLPLFDFGDRLIEKGKILAKEQYGINRGSVIHHTTDLWAAPWMRANQPYWGAWIHGGGWLAQHYWEHYRFTQDMNFLRDRAYPALKAFAAFYLDWLELDEETGRYVSYPETSPENSYFAEDGKPAAVSYGAAMGHQIIREVFDNTLAAAKILEIEDELTDEIKVKRESLTSGIKIGPDGRLLEWNKSFEEPEKGHRHMSHLYALHPGDDITISTPEEFDAAKKTISYRLEHGGAGTGWSRAWMINFNARLQDQEAAEENLYKLLEVSTGNNLFNLHPPFQIDGNFGFTAGVAELLVQSHEGFIRILPTLPPSWKTGTIKGLVARGNIEVDIKWEEGKLVKIGLLSKSDQNKEVLYNDRKVSLNLTKNKKVWLDTDLNLITE